MPEINEKSTVELFFLLTQMSALISFRSVERRKAHYENMSVQYEAISKSGNDDIFRCKNVTFFLFLLKT